MPQVLKLAGQLNRAFRGEPIDLAEAESIALHAPAAHLKLAHAMAGDAKQAIREGVEVGDACACADGRRRGGHAGGGFGLQQHDAECSLRSQCAPHHIQVARLEDAQGQRAAGK